MRIVVFCETDHHTGLALIAQARRMAPDGYVIALHEGEDGTVFLACGVDEAVRMQIVRDDCVQGSRIAEAIEKLSPEIVLFPATVRGRFLSAWTAGKLQTGLTADCTGLSLTEDGRLLQTRPAYGGNLTASILCRNTLLQMASVRPGVFPPPERQNEQPKGICRFLEFPEAAERMVPVQRHTLDGGISLRDAAVVVAGGKGIGGKEGFELLFRLAEALHGAVGATRSAVDAGWISYAHQVGQTGVTVRPKLYLAFGISGMIQHIVGMRGAKVVIAINQDRNAPIFQAADFGIVAPWRETAEYMLQRINERKGTI